MAWDTLVQECLASSQEKCDLVEEAEVYRPLSDPGDSADESSAGTSSSQQAGLEAWWVTLLEKHTRDYSYRCPSTCTIRLISGCSGMLAEAFALQDTSHCVDMDLIMHETDTEPKCRDVIRANFQATQQDNLLELFLDDVQRMEASGHAGYHIFVMKMDLSLWVNCSRPRAQNRKGKVGSNLLRRAFQELPQLPQTEGDDASNAEGARAPSVGQHCSLSLQELSLPVAACGNTFQCQLMLSACEYFCGPAKLSQSVADEAKILDRFLLTPTRPQASLVAEAASFEVHPKALTTDVLRTASAVWHLGTAAWNANIQALCHSIERGDLEGIAVFRSRTYDETPLRLRVQTKSGKEAGLGSAADVCVTKCMQTRCKLGVLVKDKDRFMYYWGIVPTYLQGMERTRGQDICLSQKKVMDAVQAADKLILLCKASIDINVADRALANFKAEACLQCLRPEDTSLHVDCEVHKMSTSVTWTLKNLALEVSGIIASSLVLKQAGLLATFKEHLFAEIASRLLIVHGNPMEGHIRQHRHEVYKTFLSGNFAREQDRKHLQLRREQQTSILNRFLCGDLESSTIEFYTQGALATEDQVLAVIKSHVIPALVPGSMPTYARHRWLGGESAIDYVALIESHHRLFSTTVARMFRANRDEEPAHTGAAAAPGVAPQAAASGWGPLEQEILGASEVVEEPDPVLVLEGDIPGDAPAGKEPADWAAFNRSMQKKMEAWATKHDLSILALIRHVLTISSHVFFAMLKRSGGQWDHAQNMLLLEGKSRSYRVTEALLSKDLDIMMDSICAAFQERPAAVPCRSMTRRHRVVMFSLLARLAGAAHFLLQSLREKCPYLPAFLLADPSVEVAEQIKAEPVCMRDKFLQKFLSLYPTADEMVSAEALAFLHGAFHLCEVDVASIESRHAVVRHLQETKNSTWQVILQTLSADHLLRQATLQNAAYQKLLEGLPGRGGIKKFSLHSMPKKSRHKGAGRADRVRRSGGAQRAFFRARMRELGHAYVQRVGLSQVYTRLHREFRGLGAEEFAHYKQLGQAAVISRRAGRRGFLARQKATRAVRVSTEIALQNPLQLDLRNQAEGLLQATRHKSRQSTHAAASKASAEQDRVVEMRQARCREDPCSVPNQVPCSMLVPALDTTAVHTSEWCVPAVDLAKAALLRCKMDWDQNQQRMPAKRLLGEAWDNLHCMQDCSHADDLLASKSKPSICLTYGMCLCSGTGLHARMFHENLARCLRPRWITRMTKAERDQAKKEGTQPQKTRARNLAEASMLVLKLSAEPMETLQLNEQGWPDPELEPAVSAPADMYVHLNYVNFKDLEFTLFRVLYVPEKQTKPDVIVLTVPSLLRVQRSCAVFAELQLDHVWKAEWYEIIVDDEILPRSEFVPNTIEVRKVSDQVLPTMAIWKGLDKELTVRAEQKTAAAANRKRGQGSAPRKHTEKRRKRAHDSSQAPGAARYPEEPSVPAGSVDASDASHVNMGAAGVGPLEGPLPDTASDSDSHGSLESWEAEALDGEVGHTTGGPTDLSDLTEWEALAEISDRSGPGAARSSGTDDPEAHVPGQADPAAADAAPSKQKLVKEDAIEFVEDGVVLGTIAWNPRSESFLARCNFENHEGCRRVRTCKPSTRSGQAGQGRPLGFLSAWLRDGAHFTDSHSHIHESRRPNRLRHRSDARAFFKTLPGAAAFLARERPRRPGEDSEPEEFN
ncbi:unnamed protein product [Symbiodinium sp. KB8]|nr:unnamed protein product [Symbiodinium sp. KB8]